jgi:50S ribosomal subunit-associated GTPase HflX
MQRASPERDTAIGRTTILIDVQLQRTDAGEHDASLQELGQLIETLGWKIAGTLTQKMSSVTAASISRRHREGLGKVAIVGYTNAGKSSLMRGLTASDVLVADQLFATLDTTVRALQPETQPRILVSDTIGFIRNLPHDLVASFRSTLDEALDASLLLHIVDASDPSLRSLRKVL